LLQRSSACRGRGGPQPLQQRGAAEQIEVLRIGVVLDIRRRIVGGRQSIPGTSDARERVKIDGPQRLVPGDPLLDLRMPDDQHQEDQQEHEARDQRRGRERPGAGHDEKRDAGNDRREAKA
jgi:hypothetical protein